MPDLIGLALIAVGTLGVAGAAGYFVLVTVPRNHGSNPGFGAFESTAAPWWIAVCAGWAIRSERLDWAGGAFLVGFILMGVLAGPLAALSRSLGRSADRESASTDEPPSAPE